MVFFFKTDLAFCYLLITDNLGTCFQRTAPPSFLEKVIEATCFHHENQGLVLLAMITRLFLVYILFHNNHVFGSQATDPHCFCLFLPAPSIHAPHWSEAALEKLFYITGNSKRFHFFHTRLLEMPPVVQYYPSVVSCDYLWLLVKSLSCLSMREVFFFFLATFEVPSLQ